MAAMASSSTITATHLTKLLEIRMTRNRSCKRSAAIIRTKFATKSTWSDHRRVQTTSLVAKCATMEGLLMREGKGMPEVGGGDEEKVVVEKEKYRYKVAGLVAAVMCLCNADRVVMSVAVVPLAAKHGWSSSFTGIVQSSFLWGYMFSSVIGGALVDKYGGKPILAWGVSLWSLATLITPWAADHSTVALLAVRACFGLAQGVTMPSMNILLSRWFPNDERASAVGVSMAGFQLGNVVGLLLTPYIISTFGISGPFIMFSSLGLIWLTSWVDGVTNDPGQCSVVSKSELDLIREGKVDSSVTTGGEHPPIGLLFMKLPSLAVILANLTNNWVSFRHFIDGLGYFVLLTWMPIYFQTVLNVNLTEAAWFSAVPWGMMAFSSYVAGAVSDHLIRAGYSLTLVRKIMQSVGFMGPAVSLLCLNVAKTPRTASVILTVALSLSSFSQAGFLLNIQDIAPQCAGLLHGIANSIGTLAAISSTIGAGIFLQWLGSFQAFLTLTALLYFGSSIFYNLQATGDRVF
ncbi:putative anion transporter 3, chloroplastic [Drosera capensis]